MITSVFSSLIDVVQRIDNTADDRLRAREDEATPGMTERRGRDMLSSSMEWIPVTCKNRSIKIEDYRGCFVPQGVQLNSLQGKAQAARKANSLG